jgi:hypothetical protein
MASSENSLLNLHLPKAVRNKEGQIPDSDMEVIMEL